MNKKVVVFLVSIVAILLLSALAIEAAYRLPSKRQGLKLGSKIDPLTFTKQVPCKDFGCGQWHVFVGDKASKKAYRCGCNVPSSLKKTDAVCLMSIANAKRAGFREDPCGKRR